MKLVNGTMAETLSKLSNFFFSFGFLTISGLNCPDTIISNAASLLVDHFPLVGLSKQLDMNMPEGSIWA